MFDFLFRPLRVTDLVHTCHVSDILPFGSHLRFYFALTITNKLFRPLGGSSTANDVTVLFHDADFLRLDSSVISCRLNVVQLPRLAVFPFRGNIFVRGFRPLNEI